MLPYDWHWLSTNHIPEPAFAFALESGNPETNARHEPRNLPQEESVMGCEDTNECFVSTSSGFLVQVRTHHEARLEAPADQVKSRLVNL